MTTLGCPWLAIMSHVRTDRNLVEIGDQGSDLLAGSVTFLRGVEEDVEDPFGLHCNDEVGCVARLSFGVGWCEHSREPWNPVKAECPFVCARVCRNVFRPRLRVEGPETSKEPPEIEIILFDGAGFSGRRA